MRRRAASGSLLFALGQPGVVAGLVPYWMTGGWNASGAPPALQALLDRVQVAASARKLARQLDPQHGLRREPK